MANYSLESERSSGPIIDSLICTSATLAAIVHGMLMVGARARAFAARCCCFSAPALTISWDEANRLSSSFGGLSPCAAYVHDL